jgi:hypothetical protein
VHDRLAHRWDAVRQVQRDLVGGNGDGDDEHDQQHQHHVDQRRGVEVADRRLGRRGEGWNRTTSAHGDLLYSMLCCNVFE